MTPTRDDVDLAAAARAGDQDGFTELVRRHQHRVRAFVAGCVPGADDELVDDIGQETFIAAHRSLADWDPERCSFSTWLLGIARHRALTHLRDQNRRRRRFANDLDAVVATACITGIEHEPSAEHDRIQALLACLDGLPDHIRQVVHARYFEQRPYEELATSGGRSATAVRMALSRARAALRTCIERRLTQASA